MGVKSFDRPVSFLARVGLVNFISNVDAALYYLTHKWPHEEGVAYALAVHACRDAVDGSGTAATARKAFIRALKEVHYETIEWDIR